MDILTGRPIHRKQFESLSVGEALNGRKASLRVRVLGRGARIVLGFLSSRAPIDPIFGDG